MCVPAGYAPLSTACQRGRPCGRRKDSMDHVKTQSRRPGFIRTRIGMPGKKIPLPSPFVKGGKRGILCLQSFSYLDPIPETRYPYLPMHFGWLSIALRARWISPLGSSWGSSFPER